MNNWFLLSSFRFMVGLTKEKGDYLVESSMFGSSVDLSP